MIRPTAIACLLTLFELVMLGPAAEKPNIIFLMVDDMGYGDLGCYGQKKIKTPNIDRMAEEGLKFTDCYCGSAVCGPTRCVLMTGLHTGHCTRRNNRAPGHKLIPLKRDDLTVATVVQRAGYATGGIGKWGVGNPGTTGTPELHGFDFFYGYLDQVHAHDHYSDHIWRSGRYEQIAGNKGGGQKQYIPDLFGREMIEFVRRNKDRPFFLYLPFTIPHGKYVVPSDEPYSGEPWSQMLKNYAAMITRMDGQAGQLFDLLKQLNLDEKTIVFFCSDNGPNPPFLQTFNSAGGLRGVKGSLYEGGIRTPMIVRWPGKTPAGKTSDFVWGHVDFFATACDIAGIEPPKTDGISVLPTLLGKEQKANEFYYWEFHGRKQQAVRSGEFKGYRRGPGTVLELYDLSKDPAEKNDIAAENPEVVKEIEDYLTTARCESPYWKFDKPDRIAPKNQKPKRKRGKT